MKPKQQELKSFLLAKPNELIVVNAHRQFGKSTAMFAIACEFAIQHPRSLIKIGATTVKQVKEILKVVEQTVLSRCPKDLRPKFNRSDGEFIFANGSVIKMIGVDIDEGNRLRGSPAHLVILDEAGFYRNLKNLVESVIEPQFLQTNGRLVMISTPSTTLSHDYTRHYFSVAKHKQTYWELPITQNPQFSEEDIQRLIEKYVGYSEDGHTILIPGDINEVWRREYMCEVFTNESLLVIPEWQAFRYNDARGYVHHELVKKQPPPVWYRPMVAMDYGFNDHTGVLFGWIDFEENKMVVRDELFVNGKTPLEVGQLIVDKCKQHFPTFPLHDILTVADIPIGILGDIKKQTGINFKFPRKYDKAMGITDLRTKVLNSKIWVHPDCRNLILQLETGTWKDEYRTDYQRTPHMGHLDLIDPLHYMNRTAEWNTNYQPPERPNLQGHYVHAGQNDKPQGAEALFGKRKYQ